VLDVRQHVEFSATEFDDTGVEMETLDSGAGKSGGQRQKLTTTCLAAALRYQLAGEDGVWPSYSTVVMDEAFDRADNDFTAMVMNIFKNFGFQVVAATPVKNVMALEPFIGGGSFVSEAVQVVPRLTRLWAAAQQPVCKNKLTASRRCVARDSRRRRRCGRRPQQRFAVSALLLRSTGHSRDNGGLDHEMECAAHDLVLIP
jgi:hypothetical protein